MYLKFQGMFVRSFGGKTNSYVFLILKLFLSMLSLFQVLTHSVSEEEIISRGRGRGVRVRVWGGGGVLWNGKMT